MRVLMVAPSYYPIKGGAETVIRNFSIKLNEIGVHTDVMTFNMNSKWKPSWQAKIEKIDNINVFKIPALNWFPLEHSDRITMGINLIPGKFRSQFKKYDIIHFHGKDLTFPLFSYAVKKKKIFHSHGFSVDFYRRYFLSRLIFKRIADVYISISQLMLKELVELGIPREKIMYIPNGVDVNFFHPSGKKESNLVLFVGRISFSKGLHILLEALGYIKKPIRLVIIGPQDWNVEYNRKILERIDQENKKGPHKITYLGAQDQQIIKKWYQRAAIFVLPSFREAFAVVNLEAMSCETPVISTNVGGIPDAVQDGKNGIIVPHNNTLRLAEAIQNLLDNEDIRISFGQEGRKLVVKSFSLEVIVQRLYDLYKKLLPEV